MLEKSDEHLSHDPDNGILKARLRAQFFPLPYSMLDKEKAPSLRFQWRLSD